MRNLRRPLPDLFRRPRVWLAAGIGFSGLVNVVEGIFPKDPDVLEWMANFLPFEISEHSRMLLLGGGFLQILLSRGLLRGKQSAWALALGMLVLLPFLHLSRAWDWHHAIVQLGLAFALFHWRGEFAAKSDGPSVRAAVLVALISVGLLTAFGLLGIHSVRGGVAGNGGLATDLRTVWELILLQGTDSLTPTTAAAATVFSVISKAGLMLGALTLVLLLRPILPRHHVTDPVRVRAVVDQFGVDPLDEFGFLRDKRHFIDSGSGCVVSYALWRNMAVTLADPVGRDDLVAEGISAFIRFCAVQDWTPVFYEIREQYLPVYRDHGFRVFKIGEDARIDVAGFSLAGKRFQNLRTSRNKIEKSGMHFSWHRGGELGRDLYLRLRAISREWLKARNTPEMTFDLGSFDSDSLRCADVCVLHDEAGHAIAFATWLPFEQGRGRALDLMRYGSQHRGVMDSVITESLLEFQRRGIVKASLGNAPLANIDPKEMDRLEERVVRALFDKFDRYYGYKSLFEFKQKFHPAWESRYVAYEGPARILAVMVAIVRVHLPTGLMKLLRS